MSRERVDRLAIVGVGVIVESDDGRILLGWRVEDRCWSLPGGLVEPGESFEQTALREVTEETGLDAIERCRTIGMSIDALQSRTHVTATVVARSRSTATSECEPSTIGQWKWVEPKDRPANLFEPTARCLRVWEGTLQDHDYIVGRE